MRLAYKERKRSRAYQAISEDGYSTKQSDRSSRSGRRSYHGANQHSEEVLEQLRSEGKCFRCQQEGHMAMDLDAPCRGKRGRHVKNSSRGRA